MSKEHYNINTTEKPKCGGSGRISCPPGNKSIGMLGKPCPGCSDCRSKAEAGEQDAITILHKRYGKPSVETIAELAADDAKEAENKRLKEALEKIVEEGNKDDRMEGEGPNWIEMMDLADKALKGE